MLSINDFVQTYNLKNKAKSNIKIYKVLKKNRTRFKSGNLFESWAVFK